MKEEYRQWLVDNGWTEARVENYYIFGDWRKTDKFYGNLNYYYKEEVGIIYDSKQKSFMTVYGNDFYKEMSPEKAVSGLIQFMSEQLISIAKSIQKITPKQKNTNDILDEPRR